MTIVNIQSNEQEAKAEEETYKMGDMFLLSGLLYCLNYCGTGIVLNNLSNGCIVRSPLIVGNVNNISKIEFETISCLLDFIPVKSVSISYSL